MATARSTRLQVGSAAWIAEERGATLQMVRSEIEDFSSQALMEVDWLNEHMADIFNENQMWVDSLSSRDSTLRSLLTLAQKRCRTLQNTRQATRKDAQDGEEEQRWRGACGAFAQGLLPAKKWC